MHKLHRVGIAALVLLCSSLVATPLLAQPYETYCQDGVDNDGDGYIDTNLINVPPGNLGPDTDCQCFDDVVPGTLQCTANDIGFVIVGLGTQTDGCVNSADMVGIEFGSTLQTTGANRYDIGMWVALDGGNARTGKCARQILVPPITFGSVPTAAQLEGGDGPFRNQENNACGDLEKFDDPSGGGAPIAYNARFNFKDLNLAPTYPTRPIYQLSCGNASNGVLNISTCIGYDQNSTTNSCNNLNQAIPGTGSKCRCQGPPSFQSNIPVPNLNLTCGGCTLDAVTGAATCNLTYTNVGVGTCNQDSSAAETEFACGTARYVRFRLDYPETLGSVTSATTCIPTATAEMGANCSAGPGRSTPLVDGSQIIWTPVSDVPNPGVGTAGWVGVNESERMYFTFVPTAPYSSADFSLIGEWSDSPTFSNAVTQTTLSCPVAVTTPVVLQRFEAREDRGEVALSWTTATETGNAGFNVYAETSQGTIRLNDELVASRRVDSIDPVDYSLRVPADGLEEAKFFVEEISTRGTARKHGPFAIGAAQGSVPELRATDWSALRAEHESKAITRARSERASGAGLEASAAGAQLMLAAGPPVAPVIDLLVARDGIYRVSYEALRAAGVDFAGVKPTDLKLENLGAEVPLYVSGARVFGPGSYVEFVGRALDTLYTGTNVYVLSKAKRALQATADATPPPAVPAATFYLDTVRVENDLAYGFSSPNGDPWIDSYLLVYTTPVETSRDVTVDHLVAGAAPVTVSVELWGATDWPQSPDHHVIARLNGVDVADGSFDGSGDFPIAVAIPEGLLQEGSNTLSILQPGDTGVEFDMVALDAYGVTYPRAFVARDGSLTFASPGARFQVGNLPSASIVAYREGADGSLARLTGVQVSAGPGGFVADLPGNGSDATYHVAATSALLQPALRAHRSGESILTGAASYLIVSHPDFLGSLGPLVQARQAQGYSVRTVDVRDVYAQFSHGVVDAAAIQDFVAYASANLGTRFVLLVGGDTYDYRGFTGTGAISFVPSLFAETGPYVRFAPVDGLVGDVDGDGVPEVAVGRMPVRSSAELQILIDRTLAYDTKPYSSTAVFAADGFDASSAVSFSLLAERSVDRLPEGWDVERAYIDHDGVAGAKSKLIDAINGGVAWTSFIGHSSPNLWTYQGLFSSADAAALENSGRPTVMTPFGCWNSYYLSPTYDSLAHNLLLSGDRGAAGLLGATTLTETVSDALLADLLVPRLAQPGMTIGQALVDAKRELAAQQPEMVDVLYGFTILGDPALVIAP